MATYKVYRKTSATEKEEIKIPYNVLSNPPDLSIYALKADIPSAITSINGLSGGTLTSPITLTGGDGATASKMILSSNGQITDTGTSTLFGFSGGNLIVGHGSYPLTMRGKQTRPTWNGNDLALKSDMPDVSGKANLNGGNTFNGKQIFQNANSGAVAECVMNDSAYDSFTVRNTSDNTKKTAISSGYVWCQDSDNVYSQFKPTGIYYGNDTSGYEGTLAFPTGISGTKTIATTDELSGKANLNGGNAFTGDQYLRSGGFTFAGTEQDGQILIDTYDDGGSQESYFCVWHSGQKDRGEIFIGNGSTVVPVQLREEYGTDGQVFTSRGANATPEWTSPAIKSATLSGTTLYLTLS